MSLNWSAKNVENWETVNTEENWPLIQNVIFYTMSVGINQLKSDNVEEFRRRLLMYSMLDGGQAMQADSERYTLELFTSLIGLSTNASTKTKTQFNKWLIEVMEDRMNRYAL